MSDTRRCPAAIEHSERFALLGVFRLLLLPFALSLSLTVFRGDPGVVQACSQPDTWSIAAAFDLAANNELPAGYPHFSTSSPVQAIPPSLLKAVGWIESGWRQYTPQGRPLVSFDFGYGIMQITSGMAGAFGEVNGDLDPATQSSIASNYEYNIGYGALMLARKWQSAPQVGDGNPDTIENWYYALWAYNGWGWVNNPNNPRFTRTGTPASNPSGFPYQERVLYLVAHPPRDADGNRLWQPVHVTLPARGSISRNPGELVLSTVHRQDPASFSAVYQPAPLMPIASGAVESVSVQVVNTGTAIWPATGSGALQLVYHVLTAGSGPLKPFSPFSAGVVAFGQAAVPLTTGVLPGSVVSLKVHVAAPAKPGTYRIVWDMQRGTNQWLMQSGVQPRVELLHVVAPDTPLPSTPTPAPHPPVVRKAIKYVADTSVPDGTLLSARQRFTKGWLVFNSGTLPWKPGWGLHLVSGASFGAQSIPVAPVQACQAFTVVAAMRAPAETGSYKGVWRMEDLQGHRFGDPLTVSVTVHIRSVRPTPVPTATATPTPSGPTPTPTAVG